MKKLILLLSVCYGATINVPADYLTIQGAINSASAGDSIFVKEGIYSPQTNDEIFPIRMISNINLIGSGKGLTVINALGNKENVRSVIEIINCKQTVIENLTITGGFCADNNRSRCNGGGIDMRDSDLTINNVTIKNNITEQTGGGISLAQSHLISNYSIIEKNVARNNWGNDYDTGRGGGISAFDSFIELINTDVLDNSANVGGGLYLFRSNYNLFSVNISDNEATKCCWCCVDGGGGILLAENYASDVWDFEYNSSAQYVTITGNYSDHRGGGINYDLGYTLNLNGFTIANNHSEIEGGGIWMSGGEIIMTNSIVWNNSSPYKPENIFWYMYSPTWIDTNSVIQYSNIEGGWADVGNINENPSFVNSEEGNYLLKKHSACVDGGTNFLILNGDTLLNINIDNYSGSSPDMGAHEYGYKSNIKK